MSFHLVIKSDKHQLVIGDHGSSFMPPDHGTCEPPSDLSDEEFEGTERIITNIEQRVERVCRFAETPKEAGLQ